MVDRFKFGNPICPLPFMQQYINTRKESCVCCYSGHEGKITSNIDFNSQEYKSIRDSILNGKWPSRCAVCKDKEANKLISPRQKYLRIYEDLMDDQIKKHKQGQDLVPYHYDLRLSNLCNLTCQMCGPGSSSSIAKKLKVNDPILEYEPDIFINPNAIHVYLAGGEPFLIKKFSKFLDQIKNTDCEIVVNTNGTIITKHLLTSLLRFKTVNITLSLDGFGDVNDKIRQGSNWETIINNLEIFKSHNFSIHANTALQKDNVNTLHKLGEFLEGAGLIKWTINEVTTPEELHWKNIDIDIDAIKMLLSLNLVKSNVESVYLINNIIEKSQTNDN